MKKRHCDTLSLIDNLKLINFPFSNFAPLQLQCNSSEWAVRVVPGKLGPGQLGPGRLGPGQLGPGARLSGAQLSDPQKLGPGA